MIQVAILGYGYWGPNLARNIAVNPECHLVAIADPRIDRLADAQRRYPGIETCESPGDLLKRKDIDAFAIATPPRSHFELALAALRHGKHVLVEKPLAGSSEQAECLIGEAERRGLTLMVDHTFVYTGAVRKICELVKDPEFGEVYYYDSVRVNLGIFQPDFNILWDLAVHDLSIIDGLLDQPIRAVSATGMSHFEGAENIAYMTLFFDGPLIAHVGVNWLAPVKVRQTLIGGSRKMILYDDVEPSEKVKVYDKGVEVDTTSTPENVRRYLRAYRTGDMWAPKLDTTEALRHVIAEFVRSIATGARPLTDGQAGLRVIRTLEAATESMRLRGQPVEISQQVFIR
ncbi:MAG: Gfo/Idh/MocA family oxidoreductase [Acidobacteriia bacterium]|nr:Gfo/Idh/MocA family oxidoreductase [Terriglobia bacterium]